MRKSATRIAVLLLGFFAPIHLFADQTLMEGDYLSQEYMQVLTKSRSPLKAFKESATDAYIFINKNHGELVLHLMPSFNHIDKVIVFDREGKAVKSDFDDYQWISNDSFSVTTNKKVVIYRRLDSLDDFIRSKTVAGTYSDADGNKYVFTENGKAIFPDQHFEYGVRYGFIESPGYDMIIRKKDKYIPLNEGGAPDYAFVIVGSTIKLRRIDAHLPWSVPEEKPFLTLKKIN